MFQLDQLAYQYPGGQTLRFPDWQLPQAGQAVLTGPSGSGKTTLLSLLGGLLSPSAGRVVLAGQDVARLPASQRDAFRGRSIGFVPQRPHLVASLSVAENLQLAQYLAHLPQDPQRIDTVLTALGIAELARRKPAQLSQGQAQRVAIARAVVNRPAVLLADEPTASLDDEATAAVLALLRSAADEAGASLLVASHDGRVKSTFATTFALSRAGVSA
ncbi:ABC transporter ATP-binding protein [Chitinimonas sp. BJYL2]|uniref:ABC transporter ATP-binding protein n=1 Tax=Chitinimonas sp. BJYL2 TaxID=2976696 RepID=UPI0022B3C39F|nr:ATP-binding cassette domain-containing protein [Chitinimonas sp. BJYL2]